MTIFLNCAYPSKTFDFHNTWCHIFLFCFFSWRGIQSLLTASTKIAFVIIVSKVRWCLNESRNDLNEGQVRFYWSRFIKCSFLFTIKSVSSWKQRQGWGLGFCSQSERVWAVERSPRLQGSCWPLMNLSPLCCLACPGLCLLLTRFHWPLSLVSVLLLAGRIAGSACRLEFDTHAPYLIGVIILNFFRELCVHWRSAPACQAWSQGKKMYSQLWGNLKAKRLSITYGPPKSHV